MFVEKLTKEQLIQFFEADDVTFTLNKDLYDKPYLYVEVEKYGIIEDLRLHDFTCTELLESEWKNFLYGIFKEDYKNAYRKFLEEDVEFKLSLLKME